MAINLNSDDFTTEEISLFNTAIRKYLMNCNVSCLGEELYPTKIRITNTLKDENGVVTHVQFHYKTDYENVPTHEVLNSKAAQKIRGLILNVKTLEIKANGIGYVNNLEISIPIVLTDDKKYVIETVEGIKYRCHQSRVITSPVEEGIILMIWKEYGIVRYSIHKQPDASCSFQYNRIYVLELYKLLLGPESYDENGNLYVGSERLFDPNKDSSPYTYYFLVIGSTRLSSPFRCDRIYYMGFNTFGTPEPSELPYTISTRWTQGVEEDEDIYYTKPIMRLPTISSLQMMNTFLFPQGLALPFVNTKDKRQLNEMAISSISEEKYTSTDTFFNGRSGFVNNNYKNDTIGKIYVNSSMSEDPRGRPGNSLIMYVTADDGQVTIYRISPPSVIYREKILNQNPNIYYSFISHINNLLKIKDYSKTNLIPFMNAETHEQIPFETNDDKIVALAHIYKLCVAPFFQDDVLTFPTKYKNDLTNLAHFITKEYDTYPRDSAQFKTILSMRKTFDRIKKYKNIKTALYNENHVSLYKMITVMMKVKKLGMLKPIILKSSNE